MRGAEGLSPVEKLAAHHEVTRRNSGKGVPRDDEISPAYRGLIDWYRNEYAGGGCREADPILSLRGLGKAVWADEDADAYVERLREGWG